MQTIRFKSEPEMWRKEYLGIKPNTLRKQPNSKEEDIRFEILFDIAGNDKNLVNIEIENTVTKEVFTRTIKDVSIYQNWYIISWFT